MIMLSRNVPTSGTCRAVALTEDAFLELYSSLEGFDGDVDRLSYVSHNCYRGQTILPAEDVPF